MRLSRLIPSQVAIRQHPIAVVVVFAHLFAATGLPVPSRSVGKDTSVPFPCQSRPCGCQTAQQCWAGACCCFTMREKLAWAAEHGFTPPPHTAAIAAAEVLATDFRGKSCCAPKAKPACCEQARPTDPESTDDGTAPTLKLVIGVFALQCHGQSGVGVTVTPPAIPANMDAVRFDPALVVGTIETLPVVCVSYRGTPPTRPPRSC